MTIYFEVAKRSGKSQWAQAQIAQVHDDVKEPLRVEKNQITK